LVTCGHKKLPNPSKFGAFTLASASSSGDTKAHEIRHFFIPQLVTCQFKNNNIDMKNLIYCGLIIILFSCRKLEFNSIQQQLYDTYTAGDTLIFSSTNNEIIKRYVIVRKENTVGGYFFQFDDPGRKRHARVIFRDLSRPEEKNPEVLSYPILIEFSNFRKWKSIDISFENFGTNESDTKFGILNTTDTINCLGKKIINYYTLTDKDSCKIIWQQKYGIIKYESHGDSLMRTNIPNIIK